MEKKYYLSIIAFATFTCSQSVFSLPQFKDTTLEAGVSGPGIVPGQSAPGMFAGIAWIDFNNDGYPDLYFVNNNGKNKLFRNNKDGSFSLANQADSSELIDKPSSSAIVGDVNNDGWDDLFVTNNLDASNVTYPNSLLINDTKGGFIDVTSSSGLINEIRPSSAAAFADVDNDGDLDLLVSQWSGSDGWVPGTGGADIKNDFYLNSFSQSGQLLFTRANNGLESFGGTVFGSMFSDYDNDGDMDLVLTHDFNPVRQMPSFFNNDGTGYFSADTNAPVLNIFGMGVSSGDYDRDGDFDYYTSTIFGFENTRNEFIKNNDGVTFDLVSESLRTTGGENIPSSNGVVYWGSAFLDADNDGDLDLYAANDNRLSVVDPVLNATKNRFYLNNGGNFDEISSDAGVDVLPGVGLAIADYNNDGRVDMVIHGQLGDAVLLKNTTTNTTHWLQVRLRGVESNKRGIGAKVRVISTYPEGAIAQLQEVQAGSSHASANSFQTHFGFPDGSAIVQLMVEWPSGLVESIQNIALDQIIGIKEGKGIMPSPLVSGLTTTSSFAGTYIGITGSHLCDMQCGSTNASEATVFIGDVPVKPSVILDDYILFIVPEGATTGNVRVSVGGTGISSENNILTITSPAN